MTESAESPLWIGNPRRMAAWAGLMLLLASQLTTRSGTPSLSKESLLWDTTLNLRGGFGFKDNVLLSSTREEASMFGTVGFDAMVLRLPIDGPQFYLFLTGDDYRYLDDVGVDKEQTFIAASKLDFKLGSAWEAGLGLQYFYQNQVFDVSATESDLTTIQLKGHGLKATPSVVRKLGKAWRLTLELPVTRQYLLEPLDDYWEGGPKLAVERQYGHRSSISAGYAFEWRIHDAREQVDRSGVTLAGVPLSFRVHEIELVDRHYWDEKRRWRTDTKAAFDQNLDNGSGFFDYHRYHLTEQIRYTTESWSVRANVRASFYRYPVQTVSSADSRHRNLTTLTVTLRGERNLAKKLKVFAEFEHEGNFSNRRSNEYSANMILGGLDWEW